MSSTIWHTFFFTYIFSAIGAILKSKREVNFHESECDKFYFFTTILVFANNSELIPCKPILMDLCSVMSFLMIPCVVATTLTFLTFVISLVVIFLPHKYFFSIFNSVGFFYFLIFEGHLTNTLIPPFKCHPHFFEKHFQKTKRIFSGQKKPRGGLSYWHHDISEKATR